MNSKSFEGKAFINHQGLSRALTDVSTLMLWSNKLVIGLPVLIFKCIVRLYSRKEYAECQQLELYSRPKLNKLRKWTYSALPPTRVSSSSIPSFLMVLLSILPRWRRWLLQLPLCASSSQGTDRPPSYPDMQRWRSRVHPLALTLAPLDSDAFSGSWWAAHVLIGNNS